MKNLILILINVMLNAAAQLFMKQGMRQIGEIPSASGLIQALPKMILNIWLVLSVFCYIMSLVLWTVVLSRVEVSYAYSFLSLVFVIVSAMGILLFNERIMPLRMAGTVLICAGVVLISKT